MTNLDSVLKTRDYSADKGHLLLQAPSLYPLALVCDVILTV